MGVRWEPPLESRRPVGPENVFGLLPIAAFATNVAKYSPLSAHFCVVSSLGAGEDDKHGALSELIVVPAEGLKAEEGDLASTPLAHMDQPLAATGAILF
ncbi:putative receptor protein kinase TMK1-like protein [Corchorus olitorius]|uniref:Receptor protein kinase TMK1-like protein n=1 Tax=Corchorus olitorius TaxID=93759 RepID=A0A1R3JM47_9ROSI|nr:putative receptor protein kinase TMK1-like protein [Corchorus olitorius]